MTCTGLALALVLINATPPEPGCAHAKSAARLWAVERAAPAMVAANADTDVLHYWLDIEIDPDAEWIEGSNTITVRSLVDGLSTFQFRLDDAFDIGDLRVGEVSVSWHRLDSATIEVTLDRVYDTDQVFELLVPYEGYPDGGGFGSIEFRRRGGAPEVWTLSEPWFAHTWWPVKDDSRDKTTADLRFTVPDEMTVASNGVLLATDDVGGGRLRYHWKTEYQTADYLYCIGATNYDTFEETWTHDDGSMPLQFFIYPEDNNEGNRNAWRENLEMLDVFSDKYGVYPFADEKYGMCQVGFGGGMEHQTMTSQGGFWESITAHEQAHQWWGDMITCATWHDIWLNEGFATFSEAVWFGNEPGGGGMAAYHNRMEQRRPTQVDGSVYVYDISNVNRIFSGNFTYRKAAWVVHMMRHVLGDAEFFEVLAAYRAAYEYDSATTDDLQIVVEGVTGRDMTWFFDEWIYDIGAPAYRTAWRAHDIAGRTYVELYIKQVQDPSYPIFTMPLDVVTDGPGGETVHVVWNDAEVEHLLFDAGSAVNQLELDPEDWTLHTSNSSTTFVEGPPKVVLTTPEPGASIPHATDLAVEITWHKDVVVEDADLSLVGEASGPVPFVLAYDEDTYTATLTPEGAPGPDVYTLTIADDVVDVQQGLRLDGEINDPIDPTALPSGDGLAGGDTVLRFMVTAIPGDADGDGDVDFGDLIEVLAAWGPCEGPCPADFDGNGVVDLQDLLTVLANWS